MPGPTLDADRIARILVDASELGDAAAAEKHEVSTKTVERYRARLAQDEAVSELVGSLKKEIVADWLESAKAARNRLLVRVEELAQMSEELHDVAGALKVVHDAVLAEELLNGSPGEQQSRSSARLGGAPKPGTALSRYADKH